MTILEQILERKRLELESSQRRVSADQLAQNAEQSAEPVRGFRRTLLEAPAPAVIAELKRRSPSRGEIRADFDPVALARSLEGGGAAALSVLTDEHYFGGQLDFLGRVRKAVALPLLRKDFVIDRYQVDEARVHGADAVLLIAAALSPENLVALRKRADELGLDVLIEVHDEGELEIALDAGADMIGVNNRDLHSFEVDLSVTERLARRIPQLQRPAARARAENGILLVAESGIESPQDVGRLQAAGARACLVGERLMREQDVGLALSNLRRKP